MKKTNNKDIFIKSAHYYDRIYQNKNYDKEVLVIKEKIKKYVNKKQISLLDLGCGTAEHCLRFAKLKYDVIGIDKSPEVLSLAEKKQLKLKNKIKFIKQNICKINLNRKFDVITCLFHVTSYLTVQKDLNNFFNSVEKQLKDDGIFIFDCWYGPGLLLDKPSVIYKKYEDKKIVIHRIKEPFLLEEKNLVKVVHNFFIEDKKTKKIIDHFVEEHLLRYFFFKEISILLKKANLKIIEWGNLENNFKSTVETDYETCFIVKKIEKKNI